LDAACSSRFVDIKINERSSRRIKVSSAIADGGESQVSMNLSQVIGQNNEIIAANSLLASRALRFRRSVRFPRKHPQNWRLQSGTHSADAEDRCRFC